MPDQGVVGPDSATRRLPGAFLNIPYDVDFQSLYLAYIAGITAFGLRPRATLEIPGGARRLDRIFDLIKSCRYSLRSTSPPCSKRPPSTSVLSKYYLKLEDEQGPNPRSKRACSPI